MMESLERLKSIGEDACGSFDAVDDDLHTPKVAKRIFGFFSVPCRSQPSTDPSYLMLVGERGLSERI